MTSAPLLEVVDLQRVFGKVRAVDDLSFTVDRGHVAGFIGPNGAGKTTTMRIAATLDVPDGGDVRIDGRSVLRDPERARRRLGFMSDRFHGYPDMTVREYLDFFARAFGLRGAERTRMLGEVTAFCGLATFLERPATGLSQGMGQRLHLAKTLLHDPPLLLLDEPASGLDPRARIELRALLRELAAAGKGILISSHILAELAEICDWVVLIEAGHLVVSGTTQEVARTVRQHQTVRVGVLRDAARCERFFLTQPMVREVAVLDEGTLVFDYLGDEEALAQLLAQAVAAKLPIFAYGPEQANLEEVFLRSTKGELQ